MNQWINNSINQPTKTASIIYAALRGVGLASSRDIRRYWAETWWEARFQREGNNKTTTTTDTCLSPINKHQAYNTSHNTTWSGVQHRDATKTCACIHCSRCYDTRQRETNMRCTCVLSPSRRSSSSSTLVDSPEHAGEARRTQHATSRLTAQ